MKDTDMVNKMKMVRFIGKYVKRYKWQYAGGILTLLVVDICNLFIPQFTGEITDGLQQGSMDAGGVLRRVFFIVGLGAVIALGQMCIRDRSALARMKRSNVATYSDVYSEIRSVFARTCEMCIRDRTV